MKTYYIAEFRYSKPNLAKVMVEQETDKTLLDFEVEHLLGYQYFGKRPRKDSLNLFDSPQTAWDWLIEAARAHVNQLQQDLAKAEKLLAELETARSE